MIGQRCRMVTYGDDDWIVKRMIIMQNQIDNDHVQQDTMYQVYENGMLYGHLFWQIME